MWTRIAAVNWEECKNDRVKKAFQDVVSQEAVVIERQIRYRWHNIVNELSATGSLECSEFHDGIQVTSLFKSKVNYFLNNNLSP